MPLEKLVLILVYLIAAAAGTVWVGTVLFASAALPFGWLAVLPVALVLYVVARVILERVGNREDDHYDKMDH